MPFLTALFALTLSALAGGSPDLNGTWSLSSSASDPVEQLLEAQGVGWMERKAAASMSVTQTITLAETSATIAVKTSVKSDTQTLKVDNQTRAVPGEHGTAQVRHYWGAEGELITVSSGPSAGGEPMEVTITRSVSSGQMHQLIEMTIGGETIRANRVFTPQ
ncbi:MAG: hypothetical protein ACI8RZ_003651 [Myxococcota bacterium]|jgi:hypothetical protein